MKTGCRSIVSRKSIFLGAILVFLLTLFVINVKEAITLKNVDIGKLTKTEVAIVKERRPVVYMRTSLVLLNIIFVVLFSIPSVVSFLEIISPFMNVWPFPLGTILELFGVDPTFNKLLLGLVIFSYPGMVLSRIYSITSVRKTIIPGTNYFYSIVQDFLKIVGDGEYKTFKGVYPTSIKTPTHAFTLGMHWDQDIHVTNYCLSLTREQLIGVLLHEAGHCYYKHYTITTIGYVALLTFLILVGGWFILWSDFADYFIYGNPPSDENEGRKAKKSPSTMRFLVFSFVILLPLIFAWLLIFNFVGRYFEYQADSFAVKMGYGEYLIDFLNGTLEFSVESKSWIYSLLYEIHPFKLARIENIKNAMNAISSGN